MGSESAATSVTHVFGSGGVVVRLAGVIDEHFPFEKVLVGLQGVVILDLERISRVTSFGVKLWNETLRKLPETYYGFIRCSPAILSQFNMMPDQFAGRGEVLSFLAPYRCAACEKDFEILVDLQQEYEHIRAFRPPTAYCPLCRQSAELDDIPEYFFSFVAAAPPPSPPSDLQGLLSSGLEAVQGPAFKVSKHIDGEVTALWWSGHIDRAAYFRRMADGLEGNLLVMVDAVTGASEEGKRGLTQFLGTCSLPSYFVSIPEALASLFAKAPAEVNVLSMRVTTTCPKSGSKWLQEVTAETLALPDGAKCPGCGEVHLVAAAVTALKGKIAPVPSALASYLAKFPNSKQRDSHIAESKVTIAERDQIFGRYRLLRLLGVGGMAEVFLARQSGVGGFEKKLVVKRILPHLSQQPDFVSMFLEEARLAARLSHPNVVQIYELGQVGSRYFMSMEYVRGFDLNIVLARARSRQQKMPVELAARLVAEVCAGLQAAHSYTEDNGTVRPIVHRDISPHNVLISVDGQVKIADFGIAKGSDSDTTTPTQSIKGKLSYMAPEILTAEVVIDGRVDIFAAGLVLLECCTLEKVMQRASNAATITALLRGTIPTLRDLLPDAPEELSWIAARALARERQERYQTAGEFQEHLEKFLAEYKHSSSRADLARWIASLEISADFSGGGIPLPDPTTSPGPKGEPTARFDKSAVDTRAGPDNHAPIADLKRT